MDNDKEYTSEEFSEAKRQLLSSLRNKDNRDKRTIIYGNDSFSVNDLIEHVNSETEVGLNHIRMIINSERRRNKLVSYKEKLIEYLRSLPNQDKPCFGPYLDRGLISPKDVLLEIETNTQEGRRYLAMYIDDCENNCEPVYIDENDDDFLPEDPNISLDFGIGWNWIMILLIIYSLLLVVLFAYISYKFSAMNPAPSSLN